MGTNYYLRKNCCDKCGRYDETHIGKSSAGWCFALHVYPDSEEKPKTLEDWKRLFFEPDNKIFNEYGDEVAPHELLRCITERSWDRKGIPFGYESNEQALRMNYAEDGPNGLWRHQVNKWHCSGHGEGTWDYLVSDFS